MGGKYIDDGWICGGVDGVNDNSLVYVRTVVKPGAKISYKWRSYFALLTSCLLNRQCP